MSRNASTIGRDVLPASFKGIPFYCTEADIQGGRRGAEGEFPFGEHTAYADLGRKIRVYALTAKFRDDGHIWDSHALFMVCELPGPGLLVHPTRGIITAACRSIKVSDLLEELAGETSVELEFVEATTKFSGILGSIFGIIATALFAVSRISALRDYTPSRVSQPWRTDVVNKAQSLVGVTAAVATQVLTTTSATSEWRTVLSMQEVAKDDGLALSASNVDTAMVNGFSLLTSNITSPDTKFDLFRKLANSATASSDLPEGPAVTSEEAVISRHRILSAIGMAEAAMGRKYATIDESLAAMDMVLAVFDDEARAAYAKGDNALFLEIKKYATQFSKMMHDLSYRLPGVVRVNFSGGVHPLVAAYTIYKDAKRHRDLEQRNNVDANGRFSPLVSGVTPT